MTNADDVQVLIVDDDAALSRLIAKTLQREGCRTRTVSSGQAALDWLSHKSADLMLLDLKLQDLGGEELIQQLAGKGRWVPFVIITGQGDERVAVEMMKRGALDYLVKDRQFLELVPTVVRRALEKLESGKRLVAAQQALEKSKTQLLMISEREQRRFGAELHDGLGQQLTAIELRCQSLKLDLPPDRRDLEQQIGEICRFLREAIAQTRALARGLSPLNLDSRRLAEALHELAGNMSKEGKVKCTVKSQPVQVDDVLVAGHLFRIAQEAAHNAIKHAQATKIAIRLLQKPDALKLEIADNGRGFPKTPKSDQGLGLQIMKHRASVIGGELQITSQSGKGVTVTCTLAASNR